MTIVAAAVIYDGRTLWTRPSCIHKAGPKINLNEQSAGFRRKFFPNTRRVMSKKVTVIRKLVWIREG
jgi:hypothetical protein